MKRTIAGIEFDVERRWSELARMWGDYLVSHETDCPQCGHIAKASTPYSFANDTIAFKCPRCGVFEWQGNKN